MLEWFWILKRSAARSAWSGSICLLGDVQETLLLLLEKDCFPPGPRAMIRWRDGCTEAGAWRDQSFPTVPSVEQRLKVADNPTAAGTG